MEVGLGAQVQGGQVAGLIDRAEEADAWILCLPQALEVGAPVVGTTNDEQRLLDIRPLELLPDAERMRRDPQAMRTL